MAVNSSWFYEKVPRSLLNKYLIFWRPEHVVLTMHKNESLIMRLRHVLVRQGSSSTYVIAKQAPQNILEAHLTKARLIATRHKRSMPLIPSIFVYKWLSNLCFVSFELWHLTSPASSKGGAQESPTGLKRLCTDGCTNTKILIQTKISWTTDMVLWN